MKKNLMTVLILALLIVNIALTGVMLVSIVGTNKKTLLRVPVSDVRLYFLLVPHFGVRT